MTRTNWTPTAAEIADRTLLTEREAGVLVRVADGMANADIADELGISKSNVEHVRYQALPNRLERTIETADEVEATFRLLAPVLDDAPDEGLRDLSETSAESLVGDIEDTVHEDRRTDEQVRDEEEQKLDVELAGAAGDALLADVGPHDNPTVVYFDPERELFFEAHWIAGDGWQRRGSSGLSALARAHLSWDDNPRRVPIEETRLWHPSFGVDDIEV